MKNIFFAVLLTTLGILHMPAFGNEECKITSERNIVGSISQNTISITGFQTGKSELTDSCKKRFISELPKYLRDDLISFFVIGYTSRSGNATDNESLARDRADHITDIIVSSNANNSQTKGTIFQIRTAGESTHNTTDFGTNDTENNPNARSVEVIFSYPQLTTNYQGIISLKEWKEKYAPNNQKCKANELFTEYISHLRAGESDDDFNSEKIDETLKECKGASNDATGTQALTILELYTKLSKYHDKFRSKVSVWKNADGNFNTARLASDSIAGVVLGTAGGLITSNIVKKNQIENGFEDIKCTIGGQNVAAWGDQFRIGIH